MRSDLEQDLHILNHFSMTKIDNLCFAICIEAKQVSCVQYLFVQQIYIFCKE